MASPLSAPTRRQRRLAYAADINLAQQARASDNLGRARQLLGRHCPRPGESDLRGWEWRYLWQECRGDGTATLCTRSNTIDTLAVSPDGGWHSIGRRREANGREAVKLWDLTSGQELLTLEGEGSLFHPICFSPDGNLLGALNSSGTLHLWRAPSWAEIEAAEKQTGGPP